MKCDAWKGTGQIMPTTINCYIKIYGWVLYVYISVFFFSTLLAILLFIKLKWFTKDKLIEISEKIELKVKLERDK